MSYYFRKTVKGSFDDVVAKTIAALKTEGFGIISDLDIEKTLHDKIGIEFRRYRILGACNPGLAYEALQLEDKIGAMLPCNVVVQQRAGEDVEVAAIDPVASMQVVDNPALKQAARHVGRNCSVQFSPSSANYVRMRSKALIPRSLDWRLAFSAADIVARGRLRSYSVAV